MKDHQLSSSSSSCDAVVGRVLFPIYVLVLFLLLYAQAGCSLFLDEAFSVFVARKPCDQIAKALQEDTWPPLYYGALHLWIALFGDGERSVRSLSLSLFLLSLMVTYHLAQSVFSERTVALYSAWLMSVMRTSVAHATNTRGYMMLYLISAIASNLFFLLAYRTERKLTYVLLYMVACYTGLMTHYSFAFVMLMHLFLSSVRLRQCLLYILFAQCVSVTLFTLTWGTVFFHQLRHIAPIAVAWIKPTSIMTVTEGLVAPLGSFTASSRSAAVTLLSWALLLLPLVLSVLRERRKVDIHTGNLLIMTAAGFGTLLIVSRFKPSYVPGRQDVIFLPLISLLFARWLCLLTSTRVTLWVLVSLSVLRLTVVTYAATRSDLGTDRWVARSICSLAQRNDVVILTDLSWCGINYYLERVCHSKDLEIIAFPADIPSHPGWRDMKLIAEPSRLEQEITALIQHLGVARSKGSKNVIIGMNPAPVYQAIPQRLDNHLTFVSRRGVPNHRKTGTFISEILYYRLTPTTPTSQPKRESQR